MASQAKRPGMRRALFCLRQLARDVVSLQEKRAVEPMNPAKFLERLEGMKVAMNAPRGKVLVHQFLQTTPATQYIVSIHPRRGKGKPFVQKSIALDPHFADAEELREDLAKRLAAQHRLYQMKAPVARPRSLTVSRGVNRVTYREDYVGPSVEEMLERASPREKARLAKKFEDAKRVLARMAGDAGYDVEELMEEVMPKNALFDIRKGKIVFTDLPFVEREKRD